MSPCAVGNGVIVCGSWGNPNRYIVSYCPTCKRRRRMLRHWAGAWYGVDDTCLTCGEQWQSGEMAPRPFRPGWRKENVKRAKAKPVISAAEFRRLTRADMEQY